VSMARASHRRPEQLLNARWLFFTLAWLVGWTVAGAAIVLAIAWTAFGREVVTIADGDLTVRQAVGRFGRTREYDLSHLRRLRIAPASFDLFSPTASMRLLGLTGGSLAFDYGARTYRLGGGIDEAEADALLKTLDTHVPASRPA
jgi:hypothetical protein